MSLPREILDQLLSGYLDDALSADERARVEQLLASDPAVASELNELRRMRAALRQVAQCEPAGSLPAGFSDRVLDAAIATAQREGLSDSHPLIKLAEQPSGRRLTASRGDSTTSWRAAAALIALAASIVIAVVLVRPDAEPQRLPEELAMTEHSQPSEQDERAERHTSPETAIAEDSLETDSDGQPSQIIDDPASSIDQTNRSDEPMIAEDQSEAATRGDDPLEPSAIAVSEGDAPAPRIPDAQPPAEAGPQFAEADSVGNPDTVANMPAQIGSRPRLASILVLDIKRTPLGRQRESVSAALQTVGIGAAAERAVTEEIVTAVNDVRAADAEGEIDVEGDPAIVYLQVSAKRLDQLILNLVADQENIESVRFMLAEDAPVLDVVQSLRPLDPTAVQHAGSWQLSSESGDLSAVLAGELSSRPNFLAMDMATAQSGAASTVAQARAAEGPSVGEDFIAPVLLVIR